MQQNEDIRDLFARYAEQVGKYLPAKGREDIEREIAATLADKLDDKTASGQTAAVDDAIALLKETGHPRKTASHYLTHGHLVGPFMYPLFLLVCRIALPVVAAVVIGALTLSAALHPDPTVGILALVLQILGQSIGGVIQAFAVIVIVFVILERVDSGRVAARELDGKMWDPRQMPKTIKIEVIKVSDQIGAIVGNVVFIAILVALPRLLALGIHTSGNAVVQVSLSDGMNRLLPFLTTWAGIQILAALFLMTRQMHTVATATVQVLIKAVGVIVAGLLLTGWPFLLAVGTAPESAELALRVVREVIRVACFLGIVGGSIDVARTLVRFRRAAKPSRA
jgi:hypothetical protein